MRRAAKVDANQDLIVSYLRNTVGAAVYPIKLPVDLLVCFRGEHKLFEVKDKKGTLTSTQKRFIASWPGKVHIVRSIDDCNEALGL